MKRRSPLMQRRTKMSNAKISMVALALGGLSCLSLASYGEAQGRPIRDRRDDRADRAIEAATGWNRLGERAVAAGAATDRDTIMVTAREGRFTSIQLRVEHSTLELFDVVVTFGDGTTFSPGTRLVFAPNTTSRVIDLPGGARVIRSVSFRYANLPGGGRAQIELWAR
jgi:hypothetical protein